MDANHVLIVKKIEEEINGSMKGNFEKNQQCVKKCNIEVFCCQRSFQKG